MRVLWITPNVPELFRSAKTGKLNRGSGGWLDTAIEGLSVHIELYILIINNEFDEGILNQDGVTFRTINYRSGVFDPSSALNVKLKKTIFEIKPDIVDFQGLEFCYASIAVELSNHFQIIGTLQGIAFEIYREYCGGFIKRDIEQNTTFVERLMKRSLFQQREKMKVRAQHELKAIKNIKTFCGRTFWDKNYIKNLVPDSNYYHIPRISKPIFHENRWTKKALDEKVLKVFVSQAHVPYKGLHDIIVASYILSNRINKKILIKVAGRSSFVKKKMGYYIPTSYGRIIQKLRKKYMKNIEITFLGSLDATNYSAELLTSHMYVQASYVENSPNGLREALLSGVPSVASDVGGTRSIIQNNKCLTYKKGDVVELSDAMSAICQEIEKHPTEKPFSSNKLSEVTPSEIIQTYLRCYEDTLGQ